MKAYKGFNNKLQCQPDKSKPAFQYEIGKTYEEPNASLCNSGFHACEYPLDCLRYYAPSSSRFCEVELDGVTDERKEDTKVCGTQIKIGAEIGISGLVKSAIEYVETKTVPNNRYHTTKNFSANSATGNQSANSATGYGSANSATGYGSANITTGYNSSNNGAGERNISVGWGPNNKCKGVIGSFIVLSEWGEWDGHKYPFIAAKMVEIDGITYKADTFYTLKNGEIVEENNE